MVRTECDKISIHKYMPRNIYHQHFNLSFSIYHPHFYIYHPQAVILRRLFTVIFRINIARFSFLSKPYNIHYMYVMINTSITHHNIHYMYVMINTSITHHNIHYMFVMINTSITRLNTGFKASKFRSVQPADICKCIYHPQCSGCGVGLTCCEVGPRLGRANNKESLSLSSCLGRKFSLLKCPSIVVLYSHLVLWEF